MSGSKPYAIFDADVIIYLASIGELELLFKKCEVFLTEIIYNQCQYYEDDRGRHSINLKEYLEKGKITLLTDIEIEEKVIKVQNRGRDGYFVVHEGELEIVLFIYKNREYKMCTGDGGAVKFMCALDMSENLISLEKIIGKQVNYQFSQKKLKKMIKEGKTMYIQHFWEDI